MQQKVVRLLSVASAAVMSVGVFTMATGQASAAVNCSAPSDQACVAVMNRDWAVGSIRVNGRCLLDTVPGQTRPYPDVRVSRTSASPYVQAYGGKRCEGGTLNFPKVRWYPETGADGFRVVRISSQMCPTPPSGIGVEIIC